MSLAVPLNSRAFGVYGRAFATVFPEHPALSGHLEYVEALHHVRHPQEMAEPEVNAFLSHLAVGRHVAAST